MKLSNVCGLSFYPCFNGIRVGTEVKQLLRVGMQDTFYPCFNGIRVGTMILDIY